MPPCLIRAFGHVRAQNLVFVSLIGRFNRTLLRHVSIGHIFFINVTFAA
jgi:hypothetical protein